jgi:hypothetical protein
VRDLAVAAIDRVPTHSDGTTDHPVALSTEVTIVPAAHDLIETMKALDARDSKEIVTALYVHDSKETVKAPVAHDLIETLSAQDVQGSREMMNAHDALEMKATVSLVNPMLVTLTVLAANASTAIRYPAWLVHVISCRSLVVT